MPNTVPPEVSRRMRRVSLAGISRLTDEERVQRTAKARTTWMASFAHKVDPDGELSDEQREALAADARRRHMTEMSKRGVAARRAKAAARAGDR